MPRVSVLIPVYNGAAAIARALRSVEAQSYTDRETVVIDDGSKDDTAEVVSSFPGVRLIRQENQGIGATRQRLLREAQGEWVAFLDHDDEWLPTKLAKQMAVADGTACVLVHGGSEMRFPDGRVERRHWRPGQGSCVLDHLLPNNEVVTSAALVRREVMAEEGFPENLSRAEDWLGWFRAGARGDFGHVPEVVAIKHEQTLSASTPDARWYAAERHVLEDHLLPNLDGWYARLPSETRERFRGVVRRKLGLIASLEAECLDREGRRDEAWERHRVALRQAPTKGALVRYFRHLTRLG